MHSIRLLASLLLLLPNAAATELRLVGSNVSAPAGSTVQISFYVSPTPIQSGRCFWNFDPAFFGQIQRVAAYSANGDVYGAPGIQGTALDMNFQSPAAGVGRLPDLPVFTVDISILPGIPVGTKSTFSLDTSPQPWLDAQGNAYTVTVVPGSVTIAGTLSVAGVQPGGGLFPAGTVLQISGIRFDPQSTLTVDGVPVSSYRVVNDTEIDFTLGGQAEIQGKRVTVRNSAGEVVEYYPSLRAESRPGHELIFPLQTQTSAIFGPGSWAVQNATPAPITVNTETSDGFDVTIATTILPPGGVTIGPQLLKLYQVYVRGSAPLRMIASQGTLDSGTLYPAGATFELRPTSIRAYPSFLDFVVSDAAPSPPAQSFVLTLFPETTEGLQAVAVTQSGGAWLSVGPPGFTIKVSVNPAGLGPGTYFGSIVLTLPGDGAATKTGTLTVPVRLEVTKGPLNLILPVVQVGGPPSVAVPGYLFSSAPTVSVGTDAGGNWLSATYQSATQTLSFQANSTGLAPGNYSGWVVLSGSGNSAVLPVLMYVADYTKLQASPNVIQFVALAGTTPPTVPTAITSPGPFTASAKTNSGGPWLKVTQAGSDSLSVSADTSGLAPGIYTGVITLISPAAPGPSQVPVTLTLTAGPVPPIIAVPAILDLGITTGIVPLSIDLALDSGFSPVMFQVRTTTADGGNWLIVHGTFSNTTPAVVSLYAYGTNPPGIYRGSVIVSSAAGDLTIPVTLTVSPPPSPSTLPPFIGSIVNAASESAGSLSPGELFTVYGFNLSNAQVLFEGASAPIVYSSATQINGVVPYEVAGGTAASITVQSTGFSVPVANSGPGIFTLTGTGLGQAAVLNEDNSINGPTNPASRGSIVQIYATGEGLTSPPLATGSTTSGIHKPVLPVQVTIGGVDTSVLFAGSAPGFIAGVLQVNAVVPVSLTPNPNTPVLLTIGNASSHPDVTIAVK